jgi:hypothetical protein
MNITMPVGRAVMNTEDSKVRAITTSTPPTRLSPGRMYDSGHHPPTNPVVNTDAE